MAEIKKAGPEVNEAQDHFELSVNHDVVSTDFVVPTREEENAVIRKLDKHLLPLVFVLYTLSVLDRSNLGNAKLAGMDKTIDLKGNHYQLLGTVFYIAYILFQWTLIGWKHFSPHYYGAFVVFFWGVIASVQAATSNWAGLMVCRFLLGVAEAMFGPGVPLYLTFFYPRERVGLRHGVFIAGAGLANAYGSALAFGISQIRGALPPWRILFLIEGLPTIAFALVAFYFLPDSISTAKFLSPREKEIALHSVSRNQKVDVNEKGGDRGVRLSQLLDAFKDPKSFMPAIMYFCCNVSFSSLPLFLPTIISEMGAFSTIQSNGFAAPPYLLCVFVIILTCWLSDRFKMRGPFCALPAALAAIGFIINATTKESGPRYFSTFLSVLIFASVAMLLAWTAGLHGNESKRGGGYVILATIGQCGPLLGTNVFPASEKPYYHKGMWVSAAMCMVVVLLSTTLSLWIYYENKQIDREEAEYEEKGTRSRPRRHKAIW